MADITVIVGVAAGVSGIILGWLVFGANRQKDAKADLKSFARLELQMEQVLVKVGKIDETMSMYKDGTGRLENRVIILEQKISALECRPPGRKRVESSE